MPTKTIKIQKSMSLTVKTIFPKRKITIPKNIKVLRRSS